MHFFLFNNLFLSTSFSNWKQSKVKLVRNTKVEIKNNHNNNNFLCICFVCISVCVCAVQYCCCWFERSEYICILDCCVSVCTMMTQKQTYNGIRKRNRKKKINRIVKGKTYYSNKQKNSLLSRKKEHLQSTVKI